MSLTSSLPFWLLLNVSDRLNAKSVKRSFVNCDFKAFRINLPAKKICCLSATPLFLAVQIVYNGLITAQASENHFSLKKGERTRAVIHALR